jgi:hypothetical protein
MNRDHLALTTMKMAALAIVLSLTACGHNTAADAQSRPVIEPDGTIKISNMRPDRRPCAEVAKRYIENIMSGNVKAADADRAGMRNGHTSAELIPALKPMGPLDHVDFLSVDKEPTGTSATVEGLFYFKGGKRKHFRAEEQQAGKWLIFEFAYSN